MSKHTVFQAPPARVIEGYALAVCQRLEETGEAAYRQPDVMRGFTAFVQTVVAISVEHGNRQSDAYSDRSAPGSGEHYLKTDAPSATTVVHSQSNASATASFVKDATN